MRGLVAALGVAETFALLTTLPHRPRITPVAARDVLQASVLSRFRVVSRSARDTQAVIDRVAKAGRSGGVIYDALAMRAATRLLRRAAGSNRQLRPLLRRRDAPDSCLNERPQLPLVHAERTGRSAAANSASEGRRSTQG